MNKFIDSTKIFAQTTKEELATMSNEQLEELVVLAAGDIRDNNDHLYKYSIVATTFSLKVVRGL